MDSSPPSQRNGSLPLRSPGVSAWLGAARLLSSMGGSMGGSPQVLCLELVMRRLGEVGWSGGRPSCRLPGLGGRRKGVGATRNTLLGTREECTRCAILLRTTRPQGSGGQEDSR